MITAWRKQARTVARGICSCAGAVACLDAAPAAAWVDITPAQGEVRLCITDAALDCTSPAGTSIPTVTFTVTAAQVGNGTAVAGTPALDFEMSVRRASGPNNVTATMTATAPATLVSGGGNTIPISDISWTSAAIAGAPGGTTTIGPGSFAAGANTIVTLIATAGGGRYYAGGTLTFQFANTKVYAQGTYGPATVNYTASQQ